MEALALVDRWPVDHVAAGVFVAGSHPVTVGDQHHRYRLASLTKPLAAWATLVAVEEGVVGLDDAVGQPGCTLRHLLAHAGGYGFEGPDPVDRPGRTRIYSNTGYELAAAHVAERAAMPFGEYLGLGVFEPLDMDTTELDGSPAHGALSTCADILRFTGELIDPVLLARLTAADAVSPQFPDLSGIVPGVGRFTPCPWGLGVEIAGDKSPHWTGRARSPRTFGHFGGAGTMMWVDPDAGCALVALTDRPFDQWAADALRRWAELSDAVIGEVTRRTGSGTG
jgi:CubicO group peptidase (beta-lactamase class C family)